MEVEDEKPKAASFTEFCFTKQEKEETGPEHVIKALKSAKAVEYQFSLEKAPTTGKLHFQGYFVLKSPIKFATALKRLPGYHLEAMKGTIEENRDYTSKEETHVAGPWNSGFAVWRDLVTGLEDVEWHPWQLEVKDLVKSKPDLRTYYWYQGPVNIGKSSMVRWLLDNTNSLIIDGSSKKSDVVNTLRNRLEPAKGEGKPIDAVVICFKAGETTGFDWSILEMLKDMYAVNTKYECLPLRWAPVHVIAFANEAPTIIGDPKRWVVKQVGYDDSAT